MELKEIVDLITIRQYVANAVGNSSIDRATVNYMNNSLIMIDRKIINLLKEDEFKSYINYENVRQSIQEVRNLNDIKSSIKK